LRAAADLREAEGEREAIIDPDFLFSSDQEEPVAGRRRGKP
jgi:hypothetical protein